MSSIYGVQSSNDSNYFSNIFGTASTSTSGSSALGDYSLIQSGAYKKLLNAYYGKQNAKSVNTENVKKEKVNLSAANNDASALNTAINKLMNTEISEDSRDKLKENLKSVVEKYNSVIDSASEVDDTSVLRQALWMTQGTSASASTLTDIGLSIGEGNKLSFDETKFDKSSLTTLRSLAVGYDSFFGRMANRANMIANSAKNAVAGADESSNYTFTADYKTFNSGNLMDTIL